MTARKSAAAKRVAGTSRNDRKPKPERAERLAKAPRPPAHLSEQARREWQQLAPVLIGLGTLTDADLRALELLAETLATAEKARRIVDEEGLTVSTADGGRKSHPAVRVMETARGQARALLGDFGLTPRGRQGLDVPPHPTTAGSGFAQFAGRGDVWSKLRAIHGGRGG